MGKYRIGLVGCGGMGRSHLKTLAGMEDFEVVGLCDISRESIGLAREICGETAGFDDYGQMYDELKPDAVTVATQTRGHHGPTVAALERGISVLCEKPISIDLQEADEMVASGEKSGAKLAINQQNHVNPAVRRGQELVREGALGELVTVRGRNKCGRKSGNEFTEMGTHVADMMLCFGGTPEWCSGSVWWEGRLAEVGDIMEAKEMSPKDRDSGLVVGERAVAQYGFAGGVLGAVSFLGYKELMNANYGIDVLGTEGQLAIRASGGLEHSLWHLPRPMEGTPSQLGDWEVVDLGAAQAEDAVATMSRELLAARDQGRQPQGSGAEGRWAFEMILGIYQSHREGGRRIDLPMPERRHPLEVWREETQ